MPTGAVTGTAGRPQHGVATGAVNRNIHLYDRIGVVIKYWKAVIVVFSLVVAGMMYKAYTTIPTYRATARVMIEEVGATAQVDFKEPYLAYQDPEPYYQTQYRILQGRDLARRVVRRLKLETEPEFNGIGPRPTRLTQLVNAMVGFATAPFGGPSAPPPTRVSAPDENALVGNFLGRVSVEPVRSSRLVDISFNAADPVLAKRAVDALAEEYVNQNLEFRLADTEKNLNWLSGEVQRQQGIVQEKETQLAEYREEQNATALGDRQDIVTSRLTQMNDAYTRARTKRIQLDSQYNQVKSTPADQLESLAAIQATPSVQQLRTRKADLLDQQVRLLQRYGEKHPDVQKNRSQVTEVNRQLQAEVQKAVESVRNEYQAALTEERQLREELDNAQQSATDLSRKSINYNVLADEAKSAREVLQQLQQRQNEVRVISNNRANNVRLLDKAEVPGSPFTPDIRRAWLMALLFGMGAGVAAAFAIDYLDDTVKTPDDIRWRLKVHFLGLVPKVRGNARPLLSDSVPPAFGEAFRALRTALVIRSGGGDTRIVAMTSAQPLEGKTTTAVNTALALAIGGARVLLIDADMRRPSVHKALRMTNQKGLAELLQAQARMREVVRTTVHPNLLAVTAGSPPANPSELLASDRMKALLQQLEAGPFDWVIIDTPPVLAVTDAVILAPMVTSVTFVVGAEMTRWRLAERAIETLQSGNPRAIGAVLNRVDFERNRYYYTRYYGQHYYSYYAEDVAAAS